MKTLEFQTEINNNQILIPVDLQPKLTALQKRNVRVIILIDEADEGNDPILKQILKTQFLKGYADTDSVYDNY